MKDRENFLPEASEVEQFIFQNNITVTDATMDEGRYTAPDPNYHIENREEPVKVHIVEDDGNELNELG